MRATERLRLWAWCCRRTGTTGKPRRSVAPFFVLISPPAEVLLFRCRSKLQEHRLFHTLLYPDCEFLSLREKEAAELFKGVSSNFPIQHQQGAIQIGSRAT